MAEIVHDGSDADLAAAAALEDALNRFAERVLTSSRDGGKVIEGVNLGLVSLRVESTIDDGGLTSVALYVKRQDGQERRVSEITFSRAGDAVH